MVKPPKRTRKRSTKSGGDCKGAQKAQKLGQYQEDPNTSVSKDLKLVVCVLAIPLACVLLVVTMRTRHDSVPENNVETKHINKPQSNQANSEKEKENVKGTVLHKPYKDFKPNIITKLNIKSLNINGATVKVKVLNHSCKESTVKVYLLESFLSDYECDSLAAVHDRHVNKISKLDPLLCFDSLKTFKQNLKEVGMDKITVSDNDFVEGTTCINESLSSLLKKHMKWSYSTSFYPGESKFSLTVAERIKQATGLSPENGGKFQITSYPKNVGYKNHTDCVEGQADKRDRFATILVYLKDVSKGGQTIFPKLGIGVTPKKGLALVWNSMTASGECDPTSIHNSAQVIRGHKYILQRWYYYQSFPSLGKRFSEPSLPPRKQNQPRVSCDQYEFGSCRWYDEWNYDHITEYVLNKNKYF